MPSDISGLFKRRSRPAKRLRRDGSLHEQKAYREHHGFEQLELRRVCDYAISSIMYGGSPVDGFSVFGTGPECLTITTNATAPNATNFTNGNDFTVLFGGQGVTGTWASNNSLTVALPALTAVFWNGNQTTTFANISITQTNVPATNTTNNSFIAYPANITSITPSSITAGQAGNLTLVAQNAARGFGNNSGHSYFLVGPNVNGTGNNVSLPLSNPTTNSTQLTLQVSPSVLNTPGTYTLQTTPSGLAPANATDTANFALVGNLSFTVNAIPAINYTIASLTYQNQPVSGWSFFGSGSENMTITLANGSTPFAANQHVWFGSFQSLNGTLGSNNLTLNVPVPYLGNYTGVPTFQNLSFGQVATPANTTNGTFQYTNVTLANITPSQVYLSGGGNFTLTANSASQGFGAGSSLAVRVVFQPTSGNATPVSGAPQNSTSLTLNMPTFTTSGNYTVFITSAASGNPQSSNALNLTVSPNPTINTLTLNFLNSTGLSNSTSPALNSFYVYAYGNVGSANGGALTGGWLPINQTTGAVSGTANTTANATMPFSGTPLANLTANLTQNATLSFNLASTIYNGTRIYLSTQQNLGSQPTADQSAMFYDFVELAASTKSIFADTSQVDQFGMPLTINLTLNATPSQILTSGTSPGLTRQDVLEGYAAAFQNQAGYNLAIVPTNGTGSNSPLTYRVLAPNDLLNALTTGGTAQSSSWTFTLAQGSGNLAGPAGNFTNWANVTLSGINVALNGSQFPNGTAVSGPWIPAGAMIANMNVASANVTTFAIGTYDTNGFPWQNTSTNTSVINTSIGGGLLFQPLNASMTSAGYQALINSFGPSIFNGNGNDPWSNLTLLNQDSAIDRAFTRYKDGTFWWQEENQPANVLGPIGAVPNPVYPQAVALYRGVVTNVSYTNIQGGTSNYAALVFTDYSNGSLTNASLSFPILYPYFTTNSPANKTDPFGRAVPAPPAWYGQNQANFEPPSLAVFAGAGIFQPGGGLQTSGLVTDANLVNAYNDLGRDVAVALSRGYSSTFLATHGNLADPGNLPRFQYTNPNTTTSGNWTMPTSVYQNLGGNVTKGMVVSSYLNFNSPMTVTSDPTPQGNMTVISVTGYVPTLPINIDVTAGKNRDNLQFVTFAETGTTYTDGTPIPYNLYESFIQSRGEFSAGVPDGQGGSEKVNIDGLGYGYAFSDYMGLSSTISVNAVTSAGAPATQSAVLNVTMQPWYNDAPVAVTYDIQSVEYGSQSIVGWSLFGSGTAPITITTTGNSSAFNPSASYNLSFGGVNMTGIATGTNTLNVSVPSLVTKWAGNGSSFANLSFIAANTTTTGNTTFAVLPVNLTSVTPNNGSVHGNTSLTLTASSPQYGFGNIANLSLGFNFNGTVKAALSETPGNATMLTLVSPSSPGFASGAAQLGVYATENLTTQNLASNTLTFTYNPLVVFYDIQSVSFAGQNITGWSLFGSGTDNVTITTTNSSLPFVPTDTYTFAFGGANVTGTATGTNALNVAVPSLLSQWVGNGTSFANLTMVGFTTTGNTSFAVLPVSLASVTPSNGSAAGGTTINLTATSKQYGFGNATNLSVGFAIGGSTQAGLNVTTVNGTTLTLQTPHSPDLVAGNAALGVYLSSNLTPANLASNNLTFTYNAVPTTYNIQSVAFQSQNITGWSLFGSGLDTLNVTTTSNSTAFIANNSYTVSFGSANATATALTTKMLSVRVPSLVPQWAGANLSFANLAILGGNTTGSTSFSVLPVNLTSVVPNTGNVTGNAAITLTASSKQYGFGNATNVSVGFSFNGTTTAALNVSVVNGTTLTLQTPAVVEPGNYTIGVYRSTGLTAANLTSNSLPFTYTERSLKYLSGDFNADNLTDIATLLEAGLWEVSFTQAAGNATLVQLNATNQWSTTVEWMDWSVLRSGGRDVIVARAEASSVGSWWKLSYDGAAGGSSAANFSTNFVGSWSSANGVQWLDVVNGDFDGDGFADIAGRDSANNQWWMLANATQTTTNGTFAAKNVYLGAWSSEAGVQWDKTLAGNFKGNPSGKDQIAGLNNGTWWISEYNGTPGSMNHTTMTTQWNQLENYTHYQVGNFDGAANGTDLIAAKTENNAWYSVGYNASITPANNTPSLMGIWPTGANIAYGNVLTGDFLGTNQTTTGIAGIQQSGSNLTWFVLQRPSVGGNYTVANFGSWPQSSVAQAFAGYFASTDTRSGVLTRTRLGASTAWQRGVSSGSAFSALAVSGYPQ